jgi:hypothetical protein
MKNVKVSSQKMIPSKGIMPQIMFDQYEFRQTGKYEANSEIVIALLEEPIW